MKRQSHSRNLRALFAMLAVIPAAHGLAAPDPDYIDHDRTRPMATVVTPAVNSTADQVGKAPSDAVVLFDGTSISNWVSAVDGSPTKWIFTNGYMECVKGSGYVRTLQNFGDCQLHIEWATPTPPHGEGQGRGNSGVFFGGERYELQVLDSYESKTYADGAAGSIYGQYPPLVNVCKPPGEWQTYDIIYTAPRFDEAGKMISPTRETALQNGVLIQNNVELTGPTGFLNRNPYVPHPVKEYIALQDHGNPVRYRNIWVRELGKPGKKEFTLPEALLKSYEGKYERDINVTKENGQLVATFGGARFVMFAESATHFFAKTTDFELDFLPNDQGVVDSLKYSVGEGDGAEEKRLK